MKKLASTSLSGLGEEEEDEMACNFVAPVWASRSRPPPHQVTAVLGLLQGTGVAFITTTVWPGGDYRRDTSSGQNFSIRGATIHSNPFLRKVFSCERASLLLAWKKRCIGRIMVQRAAFLHLLFHPPEKETYMLHLLNVLSPLSQT